MKEKPSFYAIIPANIRYDKKISPNAKLLYGEITALCNDKGYCWARNSYFAELYGVSKVTVSRWIKQLSDKKYIETEMIYKEGSKEIDKRYIRICYNPIIKNDNTTIIKNVKDNNTYKNNTYKNNTINNKEEFFDFRGLKFPIPHQEHIKKFKENSISLETFMIQNGIKNESELNEIFFEFLKHLNIEDKTYPKKDFSEFRRHFVNWSRVSVKNREKSVKINKNLYI